MNKLLLSTLTLALGGFSTFSAATAEACGTCGCRDQAPEADDSADTPGQRHAALFTSADTDESGGLSFDEFTTAMTERHAARAAGTTCEHAGTEECGCGDGQGGWRTDVDTDGDGEVSEEERDAHFLVRFAELDTDESGEVTQDEMRAGHRGHGEGNAEPACEGHGGQGHGGEGHGEHGHGEHGHGEHGHGEHGHGEHGHGEHGH